MRSRRFRPGPRSLLWDVIAVLAILALILGVPAVLAWHRRTTPSWYLGADETSITSCGWGAFGFVANVVLDNPSHRTANLAVYVEWDDVKHYPVELGTGDGSVVSVPGFESRTVTVQGYPDSDAFAENEAMPTSDRLTCKVVGPSTIPRSAAK